MEKRSQVVVGEPFRVTGNGRRYFSKAHKEAVIAQCLAPGVSLAGGDWPMDSMPTWCANGFVIVGWVMSRRSRPRSWFR